MCAGVEWGCIKQGLLQQLPAAKLFLYQGLCCQRGRFSQRLSSCRRLLLLGQQSRRDHSDGLQLPNYPDCLLLPTTALRLLRAGQGQQLRGVLHHGSVGPKAGMVPHHPQQSACSLRARLRRVRVLPSLYLAGKSGYLCCLLNLWCM